ncbi:MAG TPA: hypothetical protein VM263_01280, partial [Acidimicrobiales bacterium]|nr:hypothetical protein [Acidimicrobiales bacterium]
MLSAVAAAALVVSLLAITPPAGAQTAPGAPLADPHGPVAVRDDGVLRSGPGAVARPGRVDVVVQGTDGYYRTAWTGSAWTA